MGSLWRRPSIPGTGIYEIIQTITNAGVDFLEAQSFGGVRFYNDILHRLVYLPHAIMQISFHFTVQNGSITYAVALLHRFASPVFSLRDVT
jgi:hypothetical protein